MKKHTRIFTKICSCLLFISLLFTLSACSAAPVQEPPPEGYSFMETPPDNQIVYNTYSGEACFITTDPEKLVEFDCELIVIAKFLGNTDSFVANGDYIYTRGLFEVTDVLKGSYQDSYLEVIYEGGIVPASEYFGSSGSNNEREHQYVKQWNSDYSVDLKSGSSYVLLLSHWEDDYSILGDRFGAMPYQDGKAYDYNSSSYKTFSFMQ